MSTNKKIILFITTGDLDGIGLEVATKALQELGPQRGVRFILFGAPKILKKWTPLLSTSFNLIFTSSLKEALSSVGNEKSLICVQSLQAPAHWVEECARHCAKFPKEFGLVTGPLSKTGIQQAGYPFVGHTEMLKKITGSRYLFQTYLGSQMNVLLITDHIPLKKVPSALSPERVRAALTKSFHLKKALGLSGKVAFLALDPHAGEEGLIGTQDKALKKILQQSLFPRSQIIGPLPSDTAFEATFRRKIGLYIALYHDQGLIPFKTLHGFDEGVHLTLGLPFVRTSVDHGTAKNIFKKNCAHPGSMKHALKTAIQLVKRTEEIK